MQNNSFRAVLSLTSKDQGFPPATMYMTPGHFERNQKENTTQHFLYKRYIPGNVKA